MKRVAVLWGQEWGPDLGRRAPAPLTEVGRCQPGLLAKASFFLAAATEDCLFGLDRAAAAAAVDCLPIASAADRGSTPEDLATSLGPPTVPGKYPPDANRFSLYACSFDRRPELVPPRAGSKRLAFAHLGGATPFTTLARCGK